jgi:predicted nucleic acid-binding protein
LYASVIDGQLEVASLDTSDWERIRELVTTYASLRLGGTDASVITLAERLGTTRIATLNHRHFTVVRPRNADAFELLP